MKKSYIIFAVTLFATLSSLHATAIKPVTPGIDEWASFLNSLGYDLCSFDTSDLSESKRTIKMTIREYSGDSIINENILGAFAYGIDTRTMIDDIPEDVRDDFRRDMEEPETGVVRRIHRINIGIHRTPSDSTATCSYEIVNHVELGPINMPLKPISSPFLNKGKEVYIYVARPFEMPESLPESGFVPLVLYSSFWVDSQGIIRSCGENSISGLETSDVIKNSPHYYVIGFTII